MKIISNIGRYIKGHKVLSAIVLIIVAAVLYISLKGNAPISYDSQVLTMSSLSEEVSVTGTIQASENVDLAFERSGTVAGIYADVGDKVYAGETIVALSNADLAAEVAQKEASVQQAEARLAELARGVRPEEIAIAELQVDKARADLGESERALSDVISGAYSTADDSIRNKIDQFFTNPKTANPLLSFQTDFQLKNDIERGRVEVEKTLSTLASLSVSSSTLSTKAALATNGLFTIKTFVNNIALAVNSLSPSSNISQTTIDTWKAAVSVARTNINTVNGTLTSSVDGWKKASSSLAIAEGNLALDKAGTASEQISAQEAVVASAKAGVMASRAQLAKTIIRAPFSGILTKQDAKYGQTVQAGVSLASVISEKAYEIQAYIPEADIAKVKVRNEGSVTLDAYGSDEEFKVLVTHIDPAETMIDGVATYKTILTFVSQDERIRSGMTANIDILTNKKDGVIAIPSRAVISRDGKRFVSVPSSVDGETTKEIEVKTGIRSPDGRVEIISGLKAGDTVIVSKK